MLNRPQLSTAIVLASTLLFSSAAGASVQYKIEREALAPLSGPISVGAKTKITRIPVDGEMESLELERFEVFAKEAEIRVVGENEEVIEQLDPPNVQYYRGRIAGESDSLVFISVAGTRVDGIIFKGDRRFGIGSRLRTHRQATREGQGVDVFIQESEPSDDIPADGQGFVCELSNAPISRKPTLSSVVRELQPRAEGALSTATARWVINMAIETDYELYLNTASSSSDVETFIGNLIGAMSTIYNRDLKADVFVSYLQVHTVSDDPFTVVPGTAGTWNGLPKNCTVPCGTFTPTPANECLCTTQALLEFGDRWHNTPPSAAPRSTTALISGKSQLAGVAWVDVLCQSDFFFASGEDEPYRLHYGGRYSYNGGINPPPGLEVPDPNIPPYTAPSSNYWPLFQVSHETGHNVFSRHTHCRELSPADQITYGRQFVDNCFSGEGGCFSGTKSIPAEKGTIMSYCHLPPGNGTSTRFTFGQAGEASHVIPEDMQAAILAATPNLSAITAPASLAAGASGNASVTNVGGLTYVWTITNGVINSGQGTNTINFTANTHPTNVKINATNSAGCSITDNKDITVESVSYNPPTSVVATATSATSVSISWVTPAGTTPVQYRVYRSGGGVSDLFVNFVSHPTVVYVDNSAAANTAYLYKVRSAGAGGTNESADSNRDLATTTIFTDDPLVVPSTLVKATHITQLRTAVNAVRTLASLGGGSYTDPSLTVNVTTVKAVHINDLRTAINAARSNLALTALTYGETITATTTSIKASHVNELRNGVK